MKFKIIPFGGSYRDEMIYMILRAKEAIGRPPKINDDLLDINRYYFDRGDGFFIALDSLMTKVVGCGGYSRIDNTNEAFVHRLYVAPELKHSGIGSALLETIENAMLVKGIKVSKVHLGEPAAQWKEAYSFYPKHGYREYAPCYMKKLLDEASCESEDEHSSRHFPEEQAEFGLDADGFSLTLRTRFYSEDIALPVNGTLLVSIKSGDYSGRAELDIDHKWFNIFASKLSSIYWTLSGEARIAEPYGKQFLHFTGDGMGHIFVKGVLSDNDRHELSFENVIDQTELKDFAAALTAIYGNKHFVVNPKNE